MEPKRLHGWLTVKRELKGEIGFGCLKERVSQALKMIKQKYVREKPWFCWESGQI